MFRATSTPERSAGHHLPAFPCELHPTQSKARKRSGVGEYTVPNRELLAV
jgi:hypothetical protein